MLKAAGELGFIAEVSPNAVNGHVSMKMLYAL